MRKFLVSVALVLSACTSEQARNRDTAVVVGPVDSTASAAAPAAHMTGREDHLPETPPSLAPDLQASSDSAAALLPSMDVAANDPSAALARFLAYASIRGAPAIGSAGLSDCPPSERSADDVDEGWEPDNYVGFVLPRVLGASVTAEDTSGKSATGRAELIRVVRIDRDSPGWAGTLEERVDTLTFTLQRGSTGWAVCGPAQKVGADGQASEMVFVLDYKDAIFTEVNGAHWLPEGTAWKSVAAHADSVLRARR